MRSLTSSQPIPAASAASSTAVTDLRDMPCDVEIARPDKPSARSCSTSLALIFRTIDGLLPSRALYTRRKEPKHGGPQARHCRLPSPLPAGQCNGPRSHD
ncbi:hypothetical protein ACFFX0_18300 [Citricoccus parietis]|uniref:Uncharacterized protein n=1 Tax=Citricoccus parietis TaxID=592307 RepID=A0ABV5G3K6_9MICC